MFYDVVRSNKNKCREGGLLCNWARRNLLPFKNKIKDIYYLMFLMAVTCFNGFEKLLIKKMKYVLLSYFFQTYKVFITVIGILFRSTLITKLNAYVNAVNRDG